MEIITTLFENVLTWVLGLPLVLFTLATGIYFTVYFKFPQLRLITHAIKYLKAGEFNVPKDHRGELNQFQALCTAFMSNTGFATIISTVLALSSGGLGALFWMWLAAIFGMALQFSSVSLSMIFRVEGEKEGEVYGGPMWAIKKGMPKYFHILAYLFASGAILGALFSGNLFQVRILTQHIESTQHISPLIISTILACFVFFILIGGIKRIGRFASFAFPLTFLAFLLALILILLLNPSLSMATFGYIFQHALTGKAIVGGVFGFIIRELVNEGARRTFLNSNMAIGHTAIPSSHAVARPVGQGIVSMLIPLLDIFVVSTLTALVLTTSSVPQGDLNPLASLVPAFQLRFGDWGIYLLNTLYVIMGLMAVVGWGYAGHEGFRFLFGNKYLKFFVAFFSLITLASAFVKSSMLLGLSNTALTIIIIPNVLMCIMLSSDLKKHLKQYDADMKAHRF